MWTRRRLLFGAGAGTLLLALGGASVALRPTVLRKPRRPLRALDPTAFSILTAVVEVICPVDPSPIALEIPEDIDAFLATCDPRVTHEVAAALRLVENALPSLLLDGDLRPAFSACSIEQRRRVLRAFRDSRIGLRRTIYKALQALVTASYYGHPATFTISGYDPPDFSGFAP